MTFRTSLALLALALLALALNGCQTPGPSRFDSIDANHDGQLSLEEINGELVGKVFASRDANHDGKITLKEWHATGTSEVMFFQRDANEDRVVTVAEALAYGRKHGIAHQILLEADKNKDGLIQREEARVYYETRETRPR